MTRILPRYAQGATPTESSTAGDTAVQSNLASCRWRRRAVHAERRRGGSAHSAAEDDRVPLRVAGRDIVAEFFRHIEEQAQHSIDRPMVLAALQ